MIKRLLALFSIVVLVAATNVGVASASHRTSTDPIWPGLWDGANFDLSSITGRPKPSKPAPTPPPGLSKHP